MINRLMDKAIQMQKTMMTKMQTQMPEFFAGNNAVADTSVVCEYCGLKNNRTDSKCSGCNGALK